MLHLQQENCQTMVPLLPRYFEQVQKQERPWCEISQWCLQNVKNKAATTWRGGGGGLSLGFKPPSLQYKHGFKSTSLQYKHGEGCLQTPIPWTQNMWDHSALGLTLNFDFKHASKCKNSMNMFLKLTLIKFTQSSRETGHEWISIPTGQFGF
jgi:hypothetical protein